MRLPRVTWSVCFLNFRTQRPNEAGETKSRWRPVDRHIDVFRMDPDNAPPPDRGEQYFVRAHINFSATPARAVVLQPGACNSFRARNVVSYFYRIVNKIRRSPDFGDRSFYRFVIGRIASEFCRSPYFARARLTVADGSIASTSRSV